jgi:CcmD family protein
MENLGYLLAAYTIIWAVVFGYVLVLYRKQRKLHRELQKLRDSLDKSETDG